MTHLERLQEIIDKTPRARGLEGEPLWRDLSKPFRIDNLLVCSDQHAMAAFVSDETSDHVIRKGTEDAVRAWLCKPLGDVELDLKDLQAIVPSNPAPKPQCGYCGGTGQIICAVCKNDADLRDACESCEGGSNDCPDWCGGHEPQLIVIGNLVYDGAILREYLVVASGDTFRFVDSTVRTDGDKVQGGGEPLVLGGDGWRIAIMPTRNAITEEMPRLLLEAKSEAAAQ